MSSVILFDKFKNRKEQQWDGEETEEIVLLQDFKGQCYQVKYKKQFYDNKGRTIYTEVSRIFIKAEIL